MGSKRLIFSCYSKTYDQNGLYQAIVDLAHFDCYQVWKDQFVEKLTSKNIEDAYTSTSNTHKRKIDVGEEEEQKPNQDVTQEIKRRRMSMRKDESEPVSLTKIDK